MLCLLSVVDIDISFCRERVTSWIDTNTNQPYLTYAPHSLNINSPITRKTRCVAVRALKGLESVIDLVVTHPTWQRTRPENADDPHCGWAFYDSSDANRIPLIPPGGTEAIDAKDCNLFTFADKKFQFVRDLYEHYGEGYSGVNSVPILYDRETKSIVSNESSEIIRMLGEAFDDFATVNATENYYPAELKDEIDTANEWIYSGINNGVYKCGFAKTQEAYNDSVDELYVCLDRLEEILSQSRFVCGASSDGGSRLTEADIRLYMTLARFDEVYVVYFKCNKRRIADYHNILNYCRDLHQIHGGAIGKTINMDHIKTHYFTSHQVLNPYAVIPAGPNFEAELLKTPEGRTDKK